LATVEEAIRLHGHNYPRRPKRRRRRTWQGGALTFKLTKVAGTIMTALIAGLDFDSCRRIFVAALTPSLAGCDGSLCSSGPIRASWWNRAWRPFIAGIEARETSSWPRARHLRCQEATLAGKASALWWRPDGCWNLCGP